MLRARRVGQIRAKTWKSKVQEWHNLSVHFFYFFCIYSTVYLHIPINITSLQTQSSLLFFKKIWHKCIKLKTIWESYLLTCSDNSDMLLLGRYKYLSFFSSPKASETLLRSFPSRSTNSRLSSTPLKAPGSTREILRGIKILFFGMPINVKHDVFCKNRLECANDDLSNIHRLFSFFPQRINARKH